MRAMWKYNLELFVVLFEKFKMKDAIYIIFSWLLCCIFAHFCTEPTVRINSLSSSHSCLLSSIFPVFFLDYDKPFSKAPYVSIISLVSLIELWVNFYKKYYFWANIFEFIIWSIDVSPISVRPLTSKSC